MTGRRLRLSTALIALIPALAGCGASGAGTPLNVAGVPLAGGAKVLTAVRVCDNGVNAYCALELVLVGPGYRTSTALMLAEHRRLRQQGWASADGDIQNEQAADSPGHKLRVTYGTADQDLEGIDLGWIPRARSISLVLSRLMFDRSPAISLMLEAGSS